MPNTVRDNLIQLQGKIQTAVANKEPEPQTKALTKHMAEVCGLVIIPQKRSVLLELPLF